MAFQSFSRVFIGFGLVLNVILIGMSWPRSLPLGACHAVLFIHGSLGATIGSSAGTPRGHQGHAARALSLPI